MVFFLDSKSKFFANLMERRIALMLIRFLKLFLASVFVVTFCITCTSREDKAQEMLIQTHTMLEGTEFNYIEIKEHLNKIISEYPETDAAAAATILLDKAIEGANIQAELALRSAYSAAVSYSVSYPDAEKLDIITLREYGLGQFKDVELKIIRDGAHNFLITSEHAEGDRVYSINSDGRIESWSKG